MTDVAKFISGCMASLSVMVQLELPHVNILSKMDLVRNKKDIEEYVFAHLLWYVIVICSFAVQYSNGLCLLVLAT